MYAHVRTRDTTAKTANFPEDRHLIYVAVFGIFGGLR
jgi:hypothetical protein